MPHASRRRTVKPKAPVGMVTRIILGSLAASIAMVIVELRFFTKSKSSSGEALVDGISKEDFFLTPKGGQPTKIKDSVVEYSGDEWDNMIRESLNYVQSFKSVDRDLKFFHIPKTAGTAIEAAAGERKIPWGSCLFNHRPKRGLCNYPKGGEWPWHVGWWHVPRQFFPIKTVDPYYGAESFAVIRDPYDRMVSEFYYICSLRVTSWRPDQCNRTRLMDKAYMNEWLQEKLRAQDKKPTGATYLADNGHFIPQYDYIFGPHEVRMIDYVLKLDDSLSGDFSKLMAAYSLEGLRLRKVNAIGAKKRSDDHLGIEDMNQATTDMVRKLYANDLLM